MTVLLDTNILIDFFHDRPRSVALLKSLAESQFRISVLTLMEIVHGAYKTKTPDRYISEFKDFLTDFRVEIWLVDEEVSMRCGELMAVMENRGKSLGVVDALWRQPLFFISVRLSQEMRRLERYQDLTCTSPKHRERCFFEPVSDQR